MSKPIKQTVVDGPHGTKKLVAHQHELSLDKTYDSVHEHAVSSAEDALANPAKYGLRYKTDHERMLQNIELSPLHILYLMAIHQGDFDNRVHKGHFAASDVFGERIRFLLETGLIRYDGYHSITPLGMQHVTNLLAVKVQPV